MKKKFGILFTIGQERIKFEEYFSELKYVVNFALNNLDKTNNQLNFDFVTDVDIYCLDNETPEYCISFKYNNGEYDFYAW